MMPRRRPNHFADCPKGQRQAMTLIELLVVIAVIAALAGMFYAGALALFGKNQKKATKAIVQAAEIALRSHPKEVVTIPDPSNSSRTLQRRFGDFNNDNFLDGTPSKDFDAADATAAEEVDYGGFLTDTDFSLKTKANVDRRGRILDSWKRPLRIHFAATIYGPSGFGIFSAGPDRKYYTDDDITSWGTD